jgi:hypothetical protein
MSEIVGVKHLTLELKENGMAFRPNGEICGLRLNRESFAPARLLILQVP